MKIVASTVAMQSAHAESRSLAVSERLEAWSGTPPGRGGMPPQAQGLPSAGSVRISDEARAASAADEVESGGGSPEDDPRLSLMIRMIEFFTGKPVRLMQLGDLQAPPAASATAAAAPATSAGFGIAYDYDATYSESEQTRFEAAGSVRTADGREIRFAVGFSMTRSYTESVSVRLRAGDAELKDPLMFDFAGDAAALSDIRFRFDLDADGNAEDVPLVGGRGFLAFDRNGNGSIDDGSELFGARTGDGFAELAALDDDGNGWIDESDAAYADLRVWKPAADGTGSLSSLAAAGVGAIHLGRIDTPFSIRNAANDTLGVMRSSSIYLNEDGSAGSISQVDLSV